MANFETETNIFLLIVILAVGCWILQKANNIMRKLENMEDGLVDMKTLYLQHEVLNANSSVELTKAILKYVNKVEK